MASGRPLISNPVNWQKSSDIFIDQLYLYVFIYNLILFILLYFLSMVYQTVYIGIFLILWNMLVSKFYENLEIFWNFWNIEMFWNIFNFYFNLYFFGNFIKCLKFWTFLKFWNFITPLPIIINIYWTHSLPYGKLNLGSKYHR